MPEGGLHRARFVLALLAGALLAGCAALPKFAAPSLAVVSIKVQSADIFSQRVMVRMRVQNPNARELPVKSITYRIDVNDAEFAQGMSGTPFVVPAMGEAEFDVQVTANLAGVIAKVFSGHSPETLDYHLVGNVALSSGFLRRIPFDEHGSVKLK